MNTQTVTCHAQLEHAEALLRDVLLHESESLSSDAKSLDRILVHIGNIQQAMCVSDESHANAAKRLGDFAVTSTRISNRHPQAADKLTQLSETLRAAGSGIQSLLEASKSEPVPAPESGPKSA